MKPARGLHFVIAVAAGWSAHAQPVDELVQRALSNNREYLAGLEKIREAEALLRQAGVRPSPVVEGEGGSTRLLGAAGSQEYAIAWSQPLETGGKRSRRVAVAALGLELAKAEADERRRALALEVRRAYVEALNAGRKAAALADTARIDSEMLRLVSARVDEGDAAPLERQMLETEMARNDAERALAQARVETAVLSLRGIAALPPGAEFKPRPAAVLPAPPSAEELVRRALEGRPDLRALRLEEEQARAAAGLARAESSPDITASARYAFRSSTFDQFGFDEAGGLTRVRDRESVLAFGVSAPLFTGRKNRAGVEAAVARESEARLRREHLTSVVAVEVALALRTWQAAHQAADAYGSKILPAAERNLGIVREAWQLGQSRFLDVLNEQRRLTEMRLAQADAEAAAMRARAELENAVGGEIR